MMFTAVFMAVISVLAADGVAAANVSYDDRPKISVNGEAVVNVKPDQVVLRFGIETWDKDIMVAKRQNNEILQKALGVLKMQGVPEKEIQTDYLSIDPRWNDSFRKEFIGYFVRNVVVATISDPAKVEGLITKVLQSGVNHIHGVEFETTQLKKHREQARDMALKAAKEKAEKMAAALGRSVGQPLNISESYSGMPWRYSSWHGYGWGGGSGLRSQNVAQNVDGSGGGDGSIALGKMAIRASVSVVFELK